MDDSISDYGSDFTTDEEDILNDLLLRIPPSSLTSLRTSNNLEDGWPRMVRIPRKQEHKILDITSQSSAQIAEAQQVTLTDNSQATIYIEPICKSY